MRITLDNLQEMLDTGQLDCTCPLDDGADISVLGILGNRAHFRCRGCGWEFSRPLKKAVV